MKVGREGERDVVEAGTSKLNIIKMSELKDSIPCCILDAGKERAGNIEASNVWKIVLSSGWRRVVPLPSTAPSSPPGICIPESWVSSQSVNAASSSKEKLPTILRTHRGKSWQVLRLSIIFERRHDLEIIFEEKKTSMDTGKTGKIF